MQLGLLDFCALRKGQSPAERLFETVQTAQAAETLGFSRYWLAEHHEITYAHHSPEMMAALVAGSTERIRVGPAGMLMLLHAPMQVARSFRVLQSFFAGRMDLGVGGGGAAPEVEQALRAGAALGDRWADYSQRVEALLELVQGDQSHTFNPLDAPAPSVWMLSLGSPPSAALAARRGTCYGLSLCHKPSRDDPTPLSIYRSEFRPSAQQARPEAVIAVAGICAETDGEARRLEQATLEPGHPELNVVGSPAHCRERLEALGHRYGVEEIIFRDVSPDRESRQRSLQLLAETFRLNSPTA